MFIKTLICSVLLFTGVHSAEINECIPPSEVLFNFFDASAKIPSGLLSGNVADLGAFDLCLAIDQTVEEIRYRGKYCIVKVPLPPSLMNMGSIMSHSAVGTELHTADGNPTLEDRIMVTISDGIVGLLLGWCIPDKCPIENITSTLKTMISFGTSNDMIPPELENITIDPFLGGSCQTQEDLDNESSTWSSGDLGTVAFLSVIGGIMVLSTVYDMILRYRNQKPAHILLVAFSVRTNGEKLLAVTRNRDQLPCLHGIRFLSMMWIIFAHRFVTSFMEPVINMADFQEFKNNVQNMYVTAGPVSVDTFFFLSGLLVSYGFLLSKIKGVRFNVILYWLHRYIRLTPALGVVVLIHATILNRFGSGPFWPFTMLSVKDMCAKNWWPPLLYIQNYYNIDTICLGQSWYLSIDTQLFFISPIILVPLWQWPKYTLIASVALVIGSIVSPFVVSYHFDLSANMAENAMDPTYMREYYYPTHTRFGPWLIGIIMGYYLFKLKTSKEAHFKPSPLFVLGGWLVATAVSLTIVFAQHNLLSSNDRVANAFFNGMHRHAWSLTLCWLIYACTQGYGGPIDAFLSWPPFQVLGRFTYSMYLVHLTQQYLVAASNRTNTYYSQFNNVYRFWSDFFVTLFFAVWLSLSFESPMLVIEKVLFKTGIPPKKPEVPTQQTQTENTKS